jgi:ATP-dependent RNA helicase SUPV3L1/SUV3
VQLWALKEATPDTKGLDEVPHLASSGRTSFPADKDVPKALYRTVGYRVCGERAVRVDILERLADLIRPALAWRQGSPAPKPPGAVEGGGFTVTVNMTSLTGSSGEDFASVLRSLGYRMEKKPKPVEAPAPAPAEAAAEVQAPSTDVATDAPEAADATSSEAPVVETTSALQAAPPEPAPVVEAAAETPDAESGAPAVAEPTADVAEPFAEVKADEKPAEPEMIEVWRPGRPPEERRQRPPRREGQGERREHGARRDRRPRPQVAAAAAQDGAQAAAPADSAAAVPAAGAEAKPHQRQDRPRHGRGARPEGGERPEREGRPQQRERRGGERPDRERQDRGSRREGRRDFKDRDRGEAREWIDPKERRGQADPNSPFAKLAALKEQLEASKEGR